MERRKFLIAAGSAGLLTACSGKFNIKDLGEGDANVLGTFAVESAAVLIGYYAAQSPSADQALRGLYDLAVEGKLTPATVNTILTTLGASDPIAVIMVGRAIRMAELLGASIEGGSIVSLAGLDPKLVEACKVGYNDGYNTYKATTA